MAKQKQKKITEPCLFCGGNASKKNHLAFCTGRHDDAVDEPFSPRMALDPPPPVIAAPPPPGPPPTAEPYTNAGKGIVLKNNTTTKRAAELFDERAYWTSKELNEKLGWQFSQAIFGLRRRGMVIRTLRIGPNAYAYQRVAS